jgi:hypothetical protein
MAVHVKNSIKKEHCTGCKPEELVLGLGYLED